MHHATNSNMCRGATHDHLRLAGKLTWGSGKDPLGATRAPSIVGASAQESTQPSAVARLGLGLLCSNMRRHRTHRLMGMHSTTTGARQRITKRVKWLNRGTSDTEPTKQRSATAHDTDNCRYTKEVIFQYEMPPRPSILVMEPSSRQGLEAWRRIHHPQAVTTAGSTAS